MSAFLPVPPLRLHRSNTDAPKRHAQKSLVTPSMTAPPISRRAFTFAAFATLGIQLHPSRVSAGLFPSLFAPKKEDTSVRKRQEQELRKEVADLIYRDPTIAATLLRLAFHDSFTTDLASGRGGANGSIRFEVKRSENFGLERAVDALRPIQQKTGLGWGDAVAVAGAVAVEATGGPKIELQLGRDSASEEDPRGALPALSENVDELRARFHPRGFTDRDIVALSGAHTLGKVGGVGPFVKESNKFQNDYFQNLLWYQDLRERGLPDNVGGPPERPNYQLPSDKYLLDDPETLAIVKEFGTDQDAFFKQFVKSYQKMVSVGTPYASLS